MGSDGWFTLLLSNLFIVLGGGLGLLWKTYTVVRTARESPNSLPDTVELILVPCMRLEQGKPSPDFKSRLERALLLHQTHGATVLLLGGHTGCEISEATAGRNYLLDRGMTQTEILLEERSRNTLENMHNARGLIAEHGFERIAITSNRYHLARCQALASGLGIRAVSCAAETPAKTYIRQWPRLLLEGYYLHWYSTGKHWSRLTRNSRSLARIS
jgi:uncharacterized SAM-binding protein YcdF (DUF218 family)